MSETVTVPFEAPPEKASDVVDWVNVVMTVARIVRRYWWLVLSVSLFLTAVGALVLFTRKDAYRAEATIVLTPGLGQKGDSDLTDMATKDMSVFINTQLQLLRSATVIKGAIDSCHAGDWDEYKDLDQAQLEQKIGTSLDITMPNDTAILSVAVLSPDPTHAQNLVNAVCDSYLNACREVMREIRGERATQEENAGETSQSKYLEKCAQVDSFMKENQIAPDETVNPYEQVLQIASQNKDDADRDVMLAKYQVDMANKAEADWQARTAKLSPEDQRKPENDITEMMQLPAVQSDDTFQKMTQQIFYQEGVVAMTGATLGPDNQGMKAQSDMLWTLRVFRRSEVEAIIAGLRMQLDIAQQKAIVIDARFDDINTKYSNWRNALIQLDNLLTQKHQAETTYEDMANTTDRSQILSRMDMLPASTWNEAALPTKPYDQQSVLKLVLIFLASVVVGVLAALGYDRTDSSIRTREDLARYVHPTLLGSIPFVTAREYGQEYGKISVHYPASPVAESFRTIRTSLNIALPRTPGRARVLMMTSSIPAEGKSTCCCNLGSIFAQNNQRVLLIDADLRRPTLGKSLQLSGPRGMAEYLQGEESPEAFVQHDTALNVDVITAGHPPANPAELLSTPRHKALIEWARSRYDWVILDTPPVVPVTDARILAEDVDGIISVVRSFYTPRPIVQRGMELLRETHVPILGLICNNAEGYELGHYVRGFGYASYNYGEYKYSNYTSMARGTSKNAAEPEGRAD